MNFLTSVLPYVETIITQIPEIITAATAITAITPTVPRNPILAMVLRLLNFAAGNIGKNKNKDDIETQ